MRDRNRWSQPEFDGYGDWEHGQQAAFRKAHVHLREKKGDG